MIKDNAMGTALGNLVQILYYKNLYGYYRYIVIFIIVFRVIAPERAKKRIRNAPHT